MAVETGVRWDEKRLFEIRNQCLNLKLQPDGVEFLLEDSVRQHVRRAFESARARSREKRFWRERQ